MDDPSRSCCGKIQQLPLVLSPLWGHVRVTAFETFPKASVFRAPLGKDEMNDQNVGAKQIRQFKSCKQVICGE